MVDLDRRLAEVALHQHGLFTIDDVLLAGGTDDHAFRRVIAGRWERPYNGVYRLAGIPWTYEAEVMALVLAGRPGAAASHKCAARLEGLGFVTAKPEISLPRGRNFRPDDDGVTVHTSTDLHRCEIVMRNGVPTTDVSRTLLDLGRYIRPQALGRAVALARKKDLADWHDLAVCLATHARKGRHGITRMREVIAAGVVNDGISETDSELLALSLIREHGFEEPTLQHRVYGAEGELLAELDIAYVDRKTAFEIDGPIHLKPEVKRKDDARDDLLRARYGWTIRRVWYEIPVNEPREFVKIVRDTLSR